MEYCINYKDSVIRIAECNDVCRIDMRHCFCCNKPFDHNKTVLAVRSDKSDKYVYIHKECFDAQSQMTDALFADMERTYREYEEMKKVFGGVEKAGELEKLKDRLLWHIDAYKDAYMQSGHYSICNRISALEEVIGIIDGQIKKINSQNDDKRTLND